MRSQIIIFGDGASSGNPGPGGWGAIVLTPDDQVFELGGAEPHTTNNRMELQAVIQALEKASTILGDVEVYTDSTYVIKGVTQWSWTWKRNDWKTGEGKDVANQDLWRELLAFEAARKIYWKYVKGHAGIPGNERTDAIAVGYSKGNLPSLYRGPLSGYLVQILDLQEKEQPGAKKKSKSSAPAYSYLSVVDGVLERHTNWPECEARVKGRSGAKFRKALSAEDEKSVIRSWGFEPK
jgi:ribonuclease HI